MSGADDAVRVRILLDVDGVLNAVCHTPDLDVWPDWRKSTCMGFKIRYSPSCGARLLELAQRPGVEVRWLTTWEHNANKWIGPLFGWPDFLVMERHDILYQTRTGWWKLDEVQDLYDIDHIPFVWIDDDLGFMDYDGASDWINGLDGTGLGIQPDGEKGLTPQLLDEVERFINRWVDASEAGSTPPVEE